MTPAPFPNLHMLRTQEAIRLWEAGRIAASELEKHGGKALAQELAQMTGRAVHELERIHTEQTSHE